MHKSIKLDTPIEFINITPVNPLISKCQIKVCYVGEEANRNRSIITKDVAKQLANSIPGSPIVGYYNEENEDFEQHNRIIDLKDGEFRLKDGTRPYGFVDLNAKVWFQKFLDDDVNEHEYLMTEGYLWTGQYPEAQRILEHGNNQSMELDEKTIKAFWTRDDKGKPEFFIINEAIMSKLCILGESFEPCFEGAGIADQYIQFSFADDFKTELFNMMNQIKELLNEGGAPVFLKYAVEIGDSLWTSLYDAVNIAEYSIHGVYEVEDQKFAVLQNLADEKFYRVNFSFSEEEFALAEEMTDITESYSEESHFSVEAVAEYAKKKKEEEEEEPENKGEEKKPEEDEKPEDGEEKKPKEDEDDEDKKKKKKYNLEEVVEYAELQTNYSELEGKYNELETQFNNMKTEYESLVAFKNEVEKAKKQEMIDKFYMLSDEDKKDVTENIDKYSIDDIEAKLSIICVRNKVSFDLDDDNNKGGSSEGSDPTIYNLGGDGIEDSTPAWVKAIQRTAKKQ